MAFKFTNGKHHRNPSGCHNKVKWFLYQCKWDIKTLEDFTNNFVAFELLDRESPNPNHRGNRNTKWLHGWLDAVNIALFILDDKYRGLLPKYAYEKYLWIEKYKPYIPYETWINMTDEEKANHNWQTCDCCKRKFLADYKMNKINKRLLCENCYNYFYKV